MRITNKDFGYGIIPPQIIAPKGGEMTFIIRTAQWVEGNYWSSYSIYRNNELVLSSSMGVDTGSGHKVESSSLIVNKGDVITFEGNSDRFSKLIMSYTPWK